YPGIARSWFTPGCLGLGDHDRLRDAIMSRLPVGMDEILIETEAELRRRGAVAKSPLDAMPEGKVVVGEGDDPETQETFAERLPVAEIRGQARVENQNDQGPPIVEWVDVNMNVMTLGDLAVFHQQTDWDGEQDDDEEIDHERDGSGLERSERPGLQLTHAVGSGSNQLKVVIQFEHGAPQGSWTVWPNSSSRARSGVSQRPECTGETWIIVLRGATSQWKRSRRESRAMGPASGLPAQILGIASRCCRTSSRSISGQSARNRASFTSTRAWRKSRSRQKRMTPALTSSPRSTRGTTRMMA